MKSNPGKKLKELRLQNAMTVRQLSRKVGYAYPTLVNLENGRIPFTRATANILAQFFGVDVSVFTSGKKLSELSAGKLPRALHGKAYDAVVVHHTSMPPVTRPTPDIYEIAKNIKDLGPDQRVHLRKVLETFVW